MKSPHDYAEILATSATPLLAQEFNEYKDIGSF